LVEYNPEILSRNGYRLIGLPFLSCNGCFSLLHLSNTPSSIRDYPPTIFHLATCIHSTYL
jgi:hypothetical protein